MKNRFRNLDRSCSLPHVVGKNSQSGPDCSPYGTFGQHSTQTKLAFEHADRALDATAKPLQLPEPRSSLMPLFGFAQATHLWDANFLNTGLAQLQHVLGTVIAAIRRQLLGLYAESGFCVAQHRQQFATITGISFSNFIVNDHTGTILYELQRAAKFHWLVKFSFADGPHFRIVKRNNPLCYGLLFLKFVLRLSHNALGQFNLLRKPPLELGESLRCQTCQSLPSFAGLLHSVGHQLGHTLEDFSSFLFAFFRVRLGRLAPIENRSLARPYVVGDLFPQRGCRAGNRLYRLVNKTNIIGVADMSLKGGRVDPNPPRLNRTTLQQPLDQTLVEAIDPIFTKSLIKLNQSGGIGHAIHQRKPAKIPPRQPLSDFPLHLLVAQPPAKFQIHHAKVHAHCSTWTTQTRVEYLFKGFQQPPIRQNLIDLLEFVVPFVKRSINETVTKTHLLRYGSTHSCSFTLCSGLDPRKLRLFSENYLS